MPDDLKEIKNRVDALAEAIGNELEDINMMKDLLKSEDIDFSQMAEIEKRLSKVEGILKRFLVKFNV